MAEEASMTPGTGGGSMTGWWFVPGLPQPQGSARAFVVNGRARITSDNPKMKSWRIDVKAVAEQHVTLVTGPVEVHARFWFLRPQGHYGTGKNAGTVKASAPDFVAVKPDIDKLARALLDALTGVAYRDDAQVVEMLVAKMYCEEGPGVEVAIEALGGTP